jgi:DNA-binding XRE family transcriptional regulator
MTVQTVTLDGKRYAILEAKEYARLRALARAAESEFPPLPAPDESGNFPAVEYARASLARKIIRQRRAAGLTQADLARRAGIRPETLNRIERGKATPDIATIEKITRAIEQAQADAEPGS